MTNQQAAQTLVKRIEEIINERRSNSAVVYRQYSIDDISILNVNCDNGIFELDHDTGHLVMPNHEIIEWNETYDETNDTMTIHVKAKHENIDFDF